MVHLEGPVLLQVLCRHRSLWQGRSVLKQQCRSTYVSVARPENTCGLVGTTHRPARVGASDHNLREGIMAEAGDITILWLKECSVTTLYF